ncbi:MAG: DUF1385 domain-containing protein, partial [Deltaproteobacteria bacterium]|nr:DUF1385 domain-containing protein [Deltaproteobacteria bacterium]
AAEKAAEVAEVAEVAAKTEAEVAPVEREKATRSSEWPAGLESRGWATAAPSQLDSGLDHDQVGSVGPQLDSQAAGPGDQKTESTAGPKKSHTLEMVLGLVLGMGFGLFLFVALPHLLSFLLGVLAGFDESTFLFHLLDGLIKFGIFVGYIYLIGLYPEVGRIYAYHGAEHQAIYVFEAGLPFEPSSAKNFPTWHPRCGTAFIFLVLAASLIFFAVIFPLLPSFEHLNRLPRILAGVGIKILCTPFLAALSYEVAKTAARTKASPIWKAMVWPGLLLQRLTTRKPDDSMLEVAFKALEAVIPAKKASL